AAAAPHALAADRELRRRHHARRAPNQGRARRHGGLRLDRLRAQALPRGPLPLRRRPGAGRLRLPLRGDRRGAADDHAHRHVAHGLPREPVPRRLLRRRAPAGRGRRRDAAQRRQGVGGAEPVQGARTVGARARARRRVHAPRGLLRHAAREGAHPHLHARGRSRAGAGPRRHAGRRAGAVEPDLAERAGHRVRRLPVHRGVAGRPSGGAVRDHSLGGRRPAILPIRAVGPARPLAREVSMKLPPTHFLSEPAYGNELAGWLREFASRPENRGALVHWQVIPARGARFGELQPPLAGALLAALEAGGVSRLYTHQVCAIEALRAGRDTVVVTGTASGKSLCFHLPALERVLEAPEATALYLFPTKALAQDQLKSLTRLASGSVELSGVLRAGVYDGDTAAATRKKLRDEANVILSNPDMLHAGILPQHARWARFLRNLRYVVVDEMHAYRGIFGSHVALVLRRLERLVRHYGGDFRYVLCSATIRNPGELATALTGRQVTVVDDDGAPRGEKHFAFWNPPFRDETLVERRSSNVEGSHLLSGVLERGAQVISFTKSRVSAELVYRYTREQLERSRAKLPAAEDHAAPTPVPPLHERLKPYRGGYLPEERRAIEKALFSGELRGVVSTNALELGIDVGGLDVAVLIGAAPTLASIWQQAGRAGRSGSPALVVLVAYNDTVDQYLMRRPQYLFGRPTEAACVDPHNPYILAQQLACAAYELPLGDTDTPAFGEQMHAVLAALEEAGETRSIDGRAYWSKSDFPGAKVSLRTMSDDTYTIVDATHANAVIGTVDAI